MNAFARHAVLLFLALRAGDLVSLAAGLWLAPKYVSPAELGAVLPLASFATFVSLPVFAFALAFTREAAALSAAGALGPLRTLMRTVFAATALFAALALAAAALVLPRFLAAMRVGDAAAGYLVVAAALLGCAAPVATDALQARKRFGAYGAVEFLAALARFLVMFAVMPFRALAGYFAGQAAQPLVRLGAAFVAQRGIAAPPEPYWTRARARRFAWLFLATAAYLLAPMGAGLVEQAAIRTNLTAADSAGYFLATRLSDLLNLVTLPLLIVLFPYAADAAAKGADRRAPVLRCCAAAAVTALILAAAYAFSGVRLLALLPTGADHADWAPYLPGLVGINLLLACQTFFTNAEIASGRCGFLAWFVPLNALYALALALVRPATPASLLAWMTAVSLLRLLLCVLLLRPRGFTDTRVADASARRERVGRLSAACRRGCRSASG